MILKTPDLGWNHDFDTEGEKIWAYTLELNKKEGNPEMRWNNNSQSKRKTKRMRCPRSQVKRVWQWGRYERLLNTAENGQVNGDGKLATGFYNMEVFGFLF